MSTLKTLFVTLMLAAVVYGCNQQEDQTGRPFKISGEPVATINGVSITQSEVDYTTEVRKRMGQPTAPTAVVDDLINLELLRQAAVSDKIHLDEKIGAQLNFQISQVLANAVAQKLMEDITEDALKKAYEEQLALHSNKQYKSRHILVKTEEEAVALIESLKQGANFAELAKTKSTGPSGPNGGDLGWTNPGSFVAEFAQALVALEKGKFTTSPVKTQFGWHVILLEDTKETDAEVPSYEQLAPQLRRAVASKHIKDYIDGLRAKATIETNLAEEKKSETTDTAEG